MNKRIPSASCPSSSNEHGFQGRNGRRRSWIRRVSVVLCCLFVELPRTTNGYLVHRRPYSSMMGALSLFSSWPQKTTVNPSLKRMKTPLPLRRRQEEQLMKKNSTIESKREKILSFLRGLRRMLPTANRSRMLIVSSILLFMFTASSRPAFASSTSAGQSNLPVQLTWRNLLKAASIVAATGGLGLAVSGVPEVARALLAACARCTLQLYLIGGFVLTRMLILAQARPLLVWSWIFVTALVAAQEASSRVEYTYPRLWRHVALAVLAGAATVMGSTVVFRILGDIQPWYAPRTWIPVAGMLFGNSLSAIALAAGTVTREVVVNRDVVELRLILGATWKEALQSVLAATYSTSLTPVMNSLSVAGIVHIPGMMTGQILAGQSPFQAAAYQVLIFFLIAGMASTAVQVLSRLAVSEMVDQSADRLCIDQVTKVSGETAKEQKKGLFPDLLALPDLFFAVLEYTRRKLLGNESKDKDPESLTTNGEMYPRSVVLERSDMTDQKSALLSVRGMKVVRPNLAVSLDMFPGERIAITGRSGIGKSQVLRTLAGLEELDESTVFLGGFSIQGLKKPQYRSRVVLVPQERPLLEGTPKQFYRQIQQFHSQKIRRIVKITDSQKSPAEIAAEWDLPKEAFDQQWSTLSGGESQRALLAIALALQPDVLLLDESTSALDEITSLQVEETLKNSGIPILMVSHSQAQVDRFCNNKIDLTQAKITLGVAGNNS